MTVLLFCLMTSVSVVSSYEPKVIYRTMPRCKGVTATKHMEINKNLVKEINLQTEEEIRADGHYSGFVPIHYFINLYVNNDTHYSGNASAIVKVVRETKQLIFNIGRQGSKIDRNYIDICWIPSSQQTQNTCVTNVLISYRQEILVITFNRNLAQHTEFFVLFRMKKSPVFNNYYDKGRKGLRASLSDNSYAMFATFNTREARTLFPCMDHPSLKAKLYLCVNVHKKFKAFSITDIDQHHLNNNIQRMEYCFDTAHMVPTYAFGVVLLYNYVAINQSNLGISVYVPKSLRESFPKILPDATSTVNYLQKITNFTLPKKQINFFVVRLSGVAAVGKMRQVLLDVNAMKSVELNTYNTEVVQHETIRQWVGGIVSVKNWEDAYLREALVTYLGWLLQAPLIKGGIRTLAGRYTRLIIDDDYNFKENGTNNYNVEQLVLGIKKQPAIFLHMVMERFGAGTIEKFTSELVKKYQKGDVGIAEWDETLAAIVNDADFTRFFFSQWFYQPGPVTLEIKRQNSNKVSIRRRNSDNANVNQYISVQVFYSSDRESRRLLLGNEVGFGYYHDPFPEWYLVDPDSQTLTRKIYESSIYWIIFSGSARDHHRHLTPERLRGFTDGFCQALLRDQLPLEDNPDYKQWTAILAKVSDRTMPGFRCHCCATPSLLSTKSCYNMKNHCLSLKLIKNITQLM